MAFTDHKAHYYAIYVNQSGLSENHVPFLEMCSKVTFISKLNLNAEPFKKTKKKKSNYFNYKL